MKKTYTILILAAIIIHSGVLAQPSLSFDLKKPPKFENKILASEKTGNKKFNLKRHFIQNTVTHYNYYFNANNRLNEIITRAKATHKEDYTQLLPFYNYSLKETAAYKNDLDSVIYKSTAGVLIHDLRNDWIDNLYLLIGKAYYLRNELDSAYLTFQYVNYAFSPKEKDGYDKVIGSNQDEGSNAFSISTKENRNIVKKLFSLPPSRNESFIWQIKTYLAKDELAEAAGLIETLKHDPLFPDRLTSDLEEVQALYFYKQPVYDSAAFHLEKSLDNAENKQERARWEYLIAQLYEKSGKYELAKKFYDKTVQHSMDPVLEVYARLNSIRQNIKTGQENDIQSGINALVSMAKKDRYLFYRDIIYYTAATIELERNNPDAAKFLLLKSVHCNTNNAPQKNKSFLALGDLTFKQKKFSEAKSFYDSVDMQSVTPADVKMFVSLKLTLAAIVMQTGILDRQDSVQRIASLPPEERDAFIKKLVKQLHKQQGVKEDETGAVSNASLASNNNNTAASDLFGNNSSKGDWYFSNASLKSKGLSEFKIKWGNRLNVDNWRRQAAIVKPGSFGSQPAGGGLITGLDVAAPVIAAEINYDALLNNLPLTPEKLKLSNDSVEHALFALGKSYMNGLEDYPSAISSFEKLLSNFPSTIHLEEAAFNLYYCYSKTDNRPGQIRVKQLLATKFPQGKYNGFLNHPDLTQSPDSVKKRKATLQYDDIYNLFIEGKFSEALLRKKAADSLYGQLYWTPQLLYIEAVYHIHNREDSIAKTVLSKILQLYPTSPMHAKTANLLAVLNRRKEIEDYLTKLEIQRPKENAVVAINDLPTKKQEPKRQPVISAPVKEAPEKEQPVTIQQSKDTVAKKEEAPEEKEVLPSKEAGATTVNTENLPVTGKPRVGSALPALKADSLQLVKKPVETKKGYSDNPAEAHYVVLVLDKVDPVYATEARNAFNRYHRESYSGKNIELSSLALSDDIKLILFKSFDNAGTALDYIDKARKLTQSDIIPWLTASKYSFLMITESNLEFLKTTKDVATYKKYLSQLYPGQF